MAELSLAQRLALLSPEEREVALAGLDAEALLHDWALWRRESQTPPPGAWALWLFMAGRGAGKTRSAAEWINERVRLGHAKRIAFLGRTAADVRDVMIQGDSGVIETARPGETPVWEPSKRRVTWPNGAHALAFSADEPDQLRGPQFDTAWCDEFASFPSIPGADGLTAFANLRLGLRLPVDGDMPRMVATTTPRRVPSMFQLLEESENPEFGIVVTHATTYDNLANLATSFRATILGLYEGTRIGQQELLGEMLHDIEGALFMQAHLDASRVTELPTGIKMHTVVGVDPSVAERPKDEAGIVVVKGTAERDFFRRNLYVVEDATVLGSPAVWAKRVVDMAVKWGAPVVAEGNQGGELVRMAIGQVNSNVPVYIVHAKAGKATRAEPVAALAEQGRLHMFNYLPLLESEITSWVPAESRMSPGRLDAMVWGALALTTKVRGATFATSTSLRARSMSHHRLPQLNAANLSKRSPYKGVRR